MSHDQNPDSTFSLADIEKVCENTLAETLSIRITRCDKDCIEATMPVDQRTCQPYGLLHGGASVALAETVASFGGWNHVKMDGKVVVGQEINANHIRSVRSGLVTAVGKPLHIGKTSQVWEVKIFDEAKKLVCVSRCTLAVITA